MRKGMLVKVIGLALCVAVVSYALFGLDSNRNKLDYFEHLEDTAVTVDSENITFADLGFYILYEEQKVEEQARIYNPDSPKDYWNMHTNDTFIQREAKDAVMGMVIHDHLFYTLAVEEGLDTLTDSEEQDLQFAITDFWEDLYDAQWEHLPCDEDTINEQIRIAAVAEKYQTKLAQEKGPSFAAYNYDGYYYEQMLNEHTVTINNKLWKRFVLGDITLEHSSLNYINGLTNEDKKKKEK
ncbi:hypothetical protein [Pseudobutyrivibrio sp.]|uniref:hypothetical protein n=1 Tax=Pseudobutyrivibrio sp. TaxID=2014367 RepID=UPI001D29C81A|nr:hypothetical protein [Pseudobutyrivibrio sp.]MBE5912089.1 hypothetical protein [Pseudobutyrivibrio sp.]